MPAGRNDPAPPCSTRAPSPQPSADVGRAFGERPSAQPSSPDSIPRWRSSARPGTVVSKSGRRAKPVPARQGEQATGGGGQASGHYLTPPAWWSASDRRLPKRAAAAVFPAPDSPEGAMRRRESERGEGLAPGNCEAVPSDAFPESVAFPRFSFPRRNLLFSLRWVNFSGAPPPRLLLL